MTDANNVEVTKPDIQRITTENDPSIAAREAPTSSNNLDSTTSFTAAITNNDDESAAMVLSTTTTAVASPAVTANTNSSNGSISTPAPKARRDSSKGETDPWTYAQLSLSDVELKPRSADQPIDCRDFCVSSIKGIDVSALKYNDLRKICVRLRCPNYKNQNKEGMLQLITTAKMKEDGLLPPDYEGDLTPNKTAFGVTDALPAMRTLPSVMTSTHTGPLQSFANNVALKRKHSDSKSNSKKARHSDGGINGVHKDDDIMVAITANKVEEVKLYMANFELFCKISDRQKYLRNTVKDETNAESKKDIMEEMEKLKIKKMELNTMLWQ